MIHREKRVSVSKYRVSPLLVREGIAQTVTVTPLGRGLAFEDGTDYQVEVIPMEIYEGSFVDDRTQFDCMTVRPQNGVISVTYTFHDEQEWTLRIAPIRDGVPGKAVVVHVYSLLPDLYGRNPYRGDLHAHSTGSDGQEDPLVVAANYRKEGYDLFALTDHSNWYPSDEVLHAYGEVPVGIKLYHGEEVHLNGTIHIVGFGGKWSVTDLYHTDAEAIHAALLQEAQGMETPYGVDALEYCTRKWITEQIRAAGGMVIVPHPYWIHRPGVYNMNTKMLEYVLKTGLYDAFELTGGQEIHENNVQTAFWQQMRAEGMQIPIVGSSDSHGTDYASFFGMSKTILFAEDLEYDTVCGAVKDFYTVAVEEDYGEKPRVFGPYRLVKYARFLLSDYFPGHDELCVEQGIQMREYALGDASAADALRRLDGRVEQYRERVLRGK